MKDKIHLINKVLESQYPDADFAIWSGSHYHNIQTDNSDYDLIVVCPSLMQAHRDAFIFNGEMFDVFVHDLLTLKYYFEDNAKTGVPGTLSMAAYGLLIPENSQRGQTLQADAQQRYAKGPNLLSNDEIDKERFFITDLLLDIEQPHTMVEQIASITALYERLGAFILRSQGCWYGNGKNLVRHLMRLSESLTEEFNTTFKEAFQGNITPLILFADASLAQYGGRLFDGYHSKAPAKHRLT